ncbi:MAG: HDIG domain-containing protein [Bacteroidetes bacterium]|nr:HDIG domain-containing protein [Bacteroidota bacterium]
MIEGEPRIPTREEAVALLFEYTKTESLRKHAFAVEAVMRACAKKFGEDEDLYGLAGLLHDFDYEMYPTVEQHPYVGNKILAEKGYPEDVRQAIMGHAPYTKVPRETTIAKCLFASDELSGFVIAVALVRPTRLDGMEPSSVKKKLKYKAFAKTVSREDIRNGIAELGIPEDEHIVFVIKVLQENAGTLGLA